MMGVLLAGALACTAPSAPAAPRDHLEAQLALLLRRGQFRAAEALLSPPNPARATASDLRRRDLAAIARLAALDWRDRAMSDPIGAPDRWSVLTAIETVEIALRAARAAWPGGGAEPLTVAHAGADALEMLRTVEASYFQALVLAAIAAAQEERDLMTLTLGQAVSLAAELDAAGGAPPPLAVDTVAGNLWLQVHRYDDARAAFVRALCRDPAEPRALLGLARSLERLERHAAALDAYRAFLDVWREADPSRPELAEARRMLAMGER